MLACLEQWGSDGWFRLRETESMHQPHQKEGVGGSPKAVGTEDGGLSPNASSAPKEQEKHLDPCGEVGFRGGSLGQSVLTEVARL